jgi:hypothetical protein
VDAERAHGTMLIAPLALLGVNLVVVIGLFGAVIARRR